MNPFSIITELVKPVGDIIDNLHTSDEEKAEAKRALVDLEQDATDLLVETKGKIITAEAESEHFLTSTWRPITALVFVAIIANNYIIAPYTGALFDTKIILEIPDQMWELLKLMIGGYVASRGAEKAIKKWKE
jgi:hypothetical protein